MKDNKQFIIAGLGNPGAEYEKTRHNTGRIIVDLFRRKHDLPDWESDQKLKALTSAGKVDGVAVKLILPETMMNASGRSLVPLVKSAKAAKQLLVVHDDLDLPLGTFKISFDRGSGGHRGVESVMKSLKTRAFWRLRVGVSPKKKITASPERVVDFILGKFRPAELATLEKLAKTHLFASLQERISF